MHITYKCPHCKAAINAKKNIILAARSEDNKDSRGLALLHEEIGNYTVALSSSLKIKTGDKVIFFCPVCNTSLNSSKDDDLASFIRVDETNEETKIFISRIFGERCTFQVDRSKKVTSYGESVKQFLSPDWFI